MSLPWLEVTDTTFPDTSQALEEPNGLLAAGGDLSPERLIQAYSQGIFPWFEEDQPILWWSPDPRMVLFPEDLRISTSLRKALRKTDYRVTMDSAFAQVVTCCASPRGEDSGTWITQEMKQAYSTLFANGHAHSVEVWRADQLIGGLYGVALGQVFFGESMFSLESNASKIGFVHLVKQLTEWNYALIDCQVSTEHLESLGAVEISRKRFNEQLVTLVPRPGRTGRWNLENFSYQ